ncbi:FMN-binding protein [uncultured Brachyspira sp.]|uniref:FMN-binding protein n=1 Tax=uncultured Brachyspira sp. TaxID=221953 RepID=UPI00259B1DA5|nr:FMN-binding protein [uncultured Brachyspira sp.]
MNFKKIIISIVAFVFIFAVIVFAQAKINLSKIPNGTYLGNYKATYKGTRQGDYQVKATVSDGKLTRVVLTKSAHKSGPARSKEAYDKMIAANDIYVDGITGATWKALVEDALTKLTPAK